MKPDQAQPQLTFRPDLQGLRALAILLVILAHAGLSLFAGGFIGVDVFFVLSGYLITGLLFRELSRDAGISFLRFYARRLKRLLPALILMVLVASALALVLLSGTEAGKQLASAPFAATWTSNLFFTFQTYEYFDELSGRDLFLHTWSLGVEEQFYLVWPVLMLLFYLCGRSLRRNRNRTQLMLAGFAIAFAGSLAFSLYWTSTSALIAFYMMPARIWQFSLGAMVYLAFEEEPTGRNGSLVHLKQNLAVPALVSGLVLIIGSALYLKPDVPYPGYRALVPSFGTALVIIAGQHNAQTGVMAHPVMVWLGDRSYSLYLWHWPLLMLGFSLGYQGQALPILGLVIVTLLAAMISYRFIELPFWKGRLSHVDPLRAILISLLIMAIMVSILYRVLVQVVHTDITVDVSNEWRTDVPVIYNLPCDAWYGHARVEPCVFESGNPGKTVVLLGDSIGVQWFSMVPAIFPEPEWRTILLTKSSCPMVDKDWYYKRIGKIYQVCTDWRNAVLDRLETLKPAVVILGSASTYDFTGQEWTDGSARVFARLGKAADNVIVVPGTPNLGFNGPGCLARHLSDEGKINTQDCRATNRIKRVTPVTGYLEAAADRFDNVHVLNLNDLVCPDGICSAADQTGQVVFRDKQHLTDSFVRSKIPVIRKRIEAIINE